MKNVVRKSLIPSSGLFLLLTSYFFLLFILFHVLGICGVEPDDGLVQRYEDNVAD